MAGDEVRDVRDKNKYREVGGSTVDATREKAQEKKRKAPTSELEPQKKAKAHRGRKVKGTRRPPEGKETDGELDAAENQQRVKRLRYLAQAHNVSVNAAGRSGNKELQADHRETKNALLTHANALDRLLSLKKSEFDQPEHKLHSSFQEALNKYRKSRQDLKTYGRYDRTFTD